MENLKSDKMCTKNANNAIMDNQFKFQISYIIYCPFSRHNGCWVIEEITPGWASRDCEKVPNANQDMVQQWHVHLGAKSMLHLLSNFLCLRWGNLWLTFVCDTLCMCIKFPHTEFGKNECNRYVFLFGGEFYVSIK